jgi:hypothetical protein
MIMRPPMDRNGGAAPLPGTYCEGARWHWVSGACGTGVLPLLLLVATFAGFGCAGARVQVTRQAVWSNNMNSPILKRLQAFNNLRLILHSTLL